MWLVLLAGLVLAVALAGCDGPMPTYPPSPLPVEGRAEGGRERIEVVDSSEEEVIQVEQVPTIGGFEVVFLVMSIAALIKSLIGPRGKVLLACAVGLGVVFNGLALALSGGLVPEAQAVWVVLFVRAVGYVLATPGLYDLLRDDLLPAIGKPFGRK